MEISRYRKAEQEQALRIARLVDCAKNITSESSRYDIDTLASLASSVTLYQSHLDNLWNLLSDRQIQKIQSA